MRPKIAETVPERVWTLYGEVERIVAHLPPELEFDAVILGVRMSRDLATARGIPNCHLIARALSAVLPVIPVDGAVIVITGEGEVRALEHTWLIVRGEDPRFIIDPWPLGVVSGPALFVNGYGHHFIPGPLDPEAVSTKTSEYEALLAAVREAHAKGSEAPS